METTAHTRSTIVLFDRANAQPQNAVFQNTLHDTSSGPTPIALNLSCVGGPVPRHSTPGGPQESRIKGKITSLLCWPPLF